MNWGRLFFGVVIVAVGTVLLPDNANVLDAGETAGPKSTSAMPRPHPGRCSTCSPHSEEWR